MTDAFDVGGDAAKLQEFLKKRKEKQAVEEQEKEEAVTAQAEEPSAPAPDVPAQSTSTEPSSAPSASTQTATPSPSPVSHEAPASHRSAEDEQSRLKAMLAQKKKENAEVEPEDDDPYDGDVMARKYLAPLQKYMERDDLEDIKEIVINKPEEVGLETVSRGWVWIEDPEMTKDNLDDMARMLANRSGQLFHAGNPILSVKMPGGHRVQIVSGFNAPSGFVFSMRMQRKETFGLEDFVMDDEERERTKELCKQAKTMLVSGGTGTGKTSFLNALIPNIPDHERLITMEDVPELKIPHRNWAPLIFGGNATTVGDQGVVALLNACLRLRPDRIILGEIRKENAFAFCSAINTGHEGSLATIHANTPKMAMEAVLNRVMMNGEMPDSAIGALHRQLLDDIKAVVQLTRVGNKVEAYLLELTDEMKKEMAPK